MKNISKYDIAAFLLIVLVFFINILYNPIIPLFGDEAYYWLWSKHLALSYYDHPPMVAYLIKITTLFNTSEFSVRLMPTICFSIASIFIYKLSKEIFNEKVALFTLIISLSLPATQMGYSLATDDAPLIMFWVLSLYYGFKAIFYDDLKYYILVGVMMGFALLSKYTAILIPATFFVYLLVKEPKKLLNYKPWLSVFIVLILFFPVVYWNYEHHWISFIFQYEHGTSSNLVVDPNAILQYIGGILILFTPVFFVVYIVGIIRLKDWLRDNRRFFVMLSSLIVIIFFLYKGIFKNMEPNWYAPAIIGGIIYVGFLIDRFKLKKTFIFGLFLSILMSLLLKDPLLFPLPARLNIQNRLFGYKVAIGEYKHFIRKDYILCADYLTTASLMSFYLPNHPPVYSPFSGRESMLSFWYKNKALGKTCLVLSTSKQEIYKLKSMCKSYDSLKGFTVRKKGFLPKNFYIYLCKDVKS